MALGWIPQGMRRFGALGLSTALSACVVGKYSEVDQLRDAGGRTTGAMSGTNRSGGTTATGFAGSGGGSVGGVRTNPEGGTSSGGTAPFALGGTLASTAGGGSTRGGSSTTVVGKGGAVAMGGTAAAVGGRSAASGGVFGLSGGRFGFGGGAGTSIGSGGLSRNVGGFSFGGFSVAGAITILGGRNTGGATNSTGGNGTGGDICTVATCSSHSNCTAAKPAQALLTDFSSKANYFGSPMTTSTIYGGTLVYPSHAVCGDAEPDFPLNEDYSAGNWHITGNVGTYSGFLIWFMPCMADLSAYRGISLTLSGNVGATAMVSLSVATAANNPATSSTCSPNTATCTQTICAAASKSVPVSTSPTKLTLLWSDFSGGNPEASPNPATILSVSGWFYWDWGATTASVYPVNLVVDDITLVL